MTTTDKIGECLDSSHGMDENNKLFSDIKFVLAECDDPASLKNILINGGAKHINYLSEHVTHVVADTRCLAADEAVEVYDKPVVNSIWVHLSLKANKLLPAEAFSPTRNIFHSIIASFSSNLSRSDVETLAGAVTYFGGKVTRRLGIATHLITATSHPEELVNRPESASELKIVAPDWVLDSIKLKQCGEEVLYDPQLLVSPPPPTPPPQAAPPEPVSSVAEKPQASRPNLPEPNNDLQNKASSGPQNSAQSHPPSQLHEAQQIATQYQQSQPSIQPQQHSLPPSQIPRPRMTTNVVRGAQPRFRPLLPQNATLPHRQLMHQQSITTNQQSNLSQPNVYHQARAPYQNSQMQIRPGMAQASMMGQAQQQAQMMNRFQESSHMNQQQQPYQVNMQPQQANANFPPHGNTHRQPVYYTQNTSQMPMRMPQQAPMMRAPVQPEQLPHDNFSQPQEMLTVHPQHQQPQQQHYQNHPPQQVYQHQVQPPIQHQHVQYQQQFHQQPQPQLHSQQQSPQLSQPPQQQPHPHQQPHLHPQQQQQSQQQILQQPQHQVHHQPQQQMQQQLPQQPIMVQSRPQYQTNVSGLGGPPVRVRNPFNDQQESRFANVRATNAPRPAIQQPRGPRAPVAQPLPHPSIFDHKQESSLAQMKAKVPVIEENFEYFGHDSRDNVPSDSPLLGCKFKMIEYDDINPKQRAKWCESMKDAGASFSENLSDITHLICETRASSVFQEALSRGARCITIYWVNDIIARSKLVHPWKALHLPTSFTKGEFPLKDRIVSVTNLKGRERREVKEMILKAGAKYTDCFSQANNLLVCGSQTGEKFERAIEWRIPAVNCHFLNDLVLGFKENLDKMLSLAKYQIFNDDPPLKLQSYSLVRDLMRPWMKPIPISREESTNQPALSNGLTKVEPTDAANPLCENNGSHMPSERSDASPSSSLDSDRPQPLVRLVRKSSKPVRLLFTHLEYELTSKLNGYAQKLGLSLASSPVDCTHLVVDRISRTPKFVCAFSHASFIVSYQWIIESYDAEELLDERQFILKDHEGEKKFSFNLMYSLVKRKRRGGLLFENFIFFVTPGVLSSVANLKEMIESAGGSVMTRKLPSKAQIENLRACNKRLVVITNTQDLYLCTAIEPYKVDIVNVEFVISGILRQDIDFEAHRINNSTQTGQLFKTPSPVIEQITSPKRIRLE